MNKIKFNLIKKKIGPGRLAVPHACPLQFYPPSQRQLDEDATSESRAYAVIPERGIALLQKNV